MRCGPQVDVHGRSLGRVRRAVQREAMLVGTATIDHSEPRMDPPMKGFRPLPPRPTMDDSARLERVREFADDMQQRRTVRDFAPTSVPRAVIEQALRAAAAAPSGANQQPWRFVAVSDPGMKSRIREGAEAEEREFYGRRATEAWLDALAPLGTDANRPFLETAPW